MAKTRFPHRIICTKAFYEKNLANKAALLRKLMLINVNSKDHKKNHVVISKKDFDKILKENPNLTGYIDVLMAALKRIYEPEIIESENNSLVRVGEYAIYLTSQPPYKVCIFATKEESSEIISNPRCKHCREVEVRTDEEAILVIEEFYKMSLDKEYY